MYYKLENIKFIICTFFIFCLVFSCNSNPEKANSHSANEIKEKVLDQKCPCSDVFSNKVILDTLEKYIKSTTKIYSKEEPPTLFEIGFDREKSDTIMGILSSYFMPEIIPHMKDSVKRIGYC